MRGYLTTVPGPENAYHGSQFIIGLAPLLADARNVTAFGRIVQGREVAESLEENDALLRIEVVRKRDHAYVADESRLR